MFAQLFDVVLIARRKTDSVIGVSDEALKAIDEIYRQVLKSSDGQDRPVMVFLSKIKDYLTEYEYDSSVLVVEDLLDGDKIFVGKSYLWKKYVFPKYPVEGKPLDFKELLAICPFLGTARRVNQTQS